MLKDGAEIVRAPAKVDVKIEGEALIGVQRGKEVFGMGELVDRLSRFIVDEALPRLEPFLS